MVGRRIAIAASVCALACICCSSFSGNSPSPPDGDAGSGAPDATVDASKDGNGGVTCAAGCNDKSETCDDAHFDGPSLEGWLIRPAGDTLPAEGAVALQGNGEKDPNVLYRTIAHATSIRLEADFDFDRDAHGRLVEIKTSITTYHVDFLDDDIQIGSDGTSTTRFSRPDGDATHLVVTFDGSSMKVAVNCGEARSVDGVAIPAPIQISVGLVSDYTSSIEIGNLLLGTKP